MGEPTKEDLRWLNVQGPNSTPGLGAADHDIIERVPAIIPHVETQD